MRLPIGILLGVLLVAAPSAGQQSPVDWIVHIDRSGPIRVGMTLPQVRKALRDPHAFLEGNDPVVPLRDCSYLNSQIVPKELGFMFSRGRVVRIDVFDTGIETDFGVEIGATEADVRRLCVGRLAVEPHH